MVSFLFVHLELFDLLFQGPVFLLNRVTNDLSDHLLVGLDLIRVWQSSESRIVETIRLKRLLRRRPL